MYLMDRQLYLIIVHVWVVADAVVAFLDIVTCKSLISFWASLESWIAHAYTKQSKEQFSERLRTQHIHRIRGTQFLQTVVAVASESLISFLWLWLRESATTLAFPDWYLMVGRIDWNSPQSQPFGLNPCQHLLVHEVDKWLMIGHHCHTSRTPLQVVPPTL